MRITKELTTFITEKAFMQQIITLAKLRGFMVYHTHDSRKSTPGFPDLVLAKQGKIIFAELKTEKGRTSKHQQEWANALTHHGPRKPTHTYHEWRPSDWPTIERSLL